MSEYDKVFFKEEFEKRYRELLGDNYDEFKRVSLTHPRRSIRVNTLKMSVPELKKRLCDYKLEQIPWCKEGFWLTHKNGRRDLGNLIEHPLGYIYIQGSASMIPPLALNPKPHEFILDMAAAPGSKTTQIAQYMKNTGLIVANDYKGMRIKPLGINLQRCGITNTIVTIYQGQDMKTKKLFDRILVDAPCSGTGTIRKSAKINRVWTPKVVKRIASTQRIMSENAVKLLKPGGTMVYSTCTLEPEENEAIVSNILDKYDNMKVEKFKINIKSSNPITEYNGQSYHKDVKKCLRIWPQDNDTEGFFVAKFKKLE